MMTRLIRVLRTCALGAPVFNALFPLDAISGEKLLYSNPRLLRSSQLGETCPTPLPMRSMALFGTLAGTRILGLPQLHLGRSATVILPSTPMVYMYVGVITSSGTRGCRVKTSSTSVSSGTSLSTCVW